MYPTTYIFYAIGVALDYQCNSDASCITTYTKIVPHLNFINDVMEKN